MELTHEMLDRLNQLQDKYAVMGQDMLSYLDGLLYADYLTYWDYIHLDTLLSLQTPRTRFPDERIFIIYHQITELYFKLSIQAIEQLFGQEAPSPDLFKRQLRRLNGYWENLIHSFDIMVSGMDKEEFLKFRMSLLPASGFQSAQYRQIEIMSTDLHHLVRVDLREAGDDEAPVEALYPRLYWKSGATELATGKKTLTLRQFERKYSDTFLRLAADMRRRNLLKCFQQLAPSQKDEELIQLMKEYDFNANVRWRLSHLRAAGRYLDNKPKVIEATGGTNWQHYLPPRNQRIVFFPGLWKEEELAEWGRKWERV
jgi:tryptophan 2,3-dioxygenase